MVLELTNNELSELKSSIDFNVIAILSNSLTDNILNMSDYHTGLLYDFCCESENDVLINLAHRIVREDREHVIKPIALESI